MLRGTMTKSALKMHISVKLLISLVARVCTALHCRLCRVLSKNWEIFLCNPLQDLLLCYVTWGLFGHDIFLSTARANEVSVLVIYHKFPQKALNEVFFQLRLGTVEVLEFSPLPKS